jgi:hypothetical protein
MAPCRNHFHRRVIARRSSRGGSACCTSSPGFPESRGSRRLLGDQPWQNAIQLLTGGLMVVCGVSVGAGRRSVAPRDRAEHRMVGVFLSVMGLLIALGALLFTVGG